MSLLNPLTVSSSASLYRANLPDSNLASSLQILIGSTPETRAICNDPLVSGYRYTQSLSEGCEKLLKLMQELKITQLTEKETTVLHVLRGGLNFGLREALARGCGFNDHCSAYISAQRARSHEDPKDWVITEQSYQKLHLLPRNQIVLGDVVATGTSLLYALERIGIESNKHSAEIRDLVFFTIGGPRSHAILSQTAKRFSQIFKNFRSAVVVYLEGIFPVATDATPVSIKIDGTDLLRGDGAVLAPEFIESQYQSPLYPLERCTIYDAGSRAFSRNEYFKDVIEYWETTKRLADRGTTFAQLLKERMPQLDAARFAHAGDLKQLCENHLHALMARTDE